MFRTVADVYWISAPDWDLREGGSRLDETSDRASPKDFATRSSKGTGVEELVFCGSRVVIPQALPLLIGPSKSSPGCNASQAAPIEQRICSLSSDFLRLAISPHQHDALVSSCELANVLYTAIDVVDVSHRSGSAHCSCGDADISTSVWNFIFAISREQNEMFDWVPSQCIP